MIQKKSKFNSRLLSIMLFLFLGVIGLVASQRWFLYTWNLTESLPGHVYVIQKGAPVKRGDIIGFYWHGGATYPKGEIFLKLVRGVPGDGITVKGREVYVNNTLIGHAKDKSKAGIPLEVTHKLEVGQDELFVATPHRDSFDSRYEMVGNIKQSEVIGRAYEIF